MNAPEAWLSQPVPNPPLRREPPQFPPAWASRWGDDRFGLWATLEVKGVAQRFRWIEPGTFLMGTSDAQMAVIEKRLAGEDWAALYGDKNLKRIQKDYLDWIKNEQPQHAVTLIQGYWLADTVCTNGLWRAVQGSHPADSGSMQTRDVNMPVVEVSWDDVDAFCRQLAEDLPPRWHASLPTEAQWEYACRAGSGTLYAWGDKPDPQRMNVKESGIGRPIEAEKIARAAPDQPPVALTPRPNQWGLQQMHGNVWEWCDGYRRDYGSDRVDDPPDQQHPVRRALRGGSWRFPAQRARAAYRYRNLRTARYDDIGFRLVLRSIEPSQR